MICDPWLRFHIGRRADLSGIPWGLWFMWKPRPYPLEWKPLSSEEYIHVLTLEGAYDFLTAHRERAAKEGLMRATERGYWRDTAPRFGQIPYAWKLGFNIGGWGRYWPLFDLELGGGAHGRRFLWPRYRCQTEQETA